MRKTVQTEGDEGERGGRCLIIQQHQSSLFLALLDERGGTKPTGGTGLGRRSSPRKDGKQKEKRD